MSRKPPMSSTLPCALRRARGSTHFARNGRKRGPERNPPISGSSIPPFRVGCPLTSGSAITLRAAGLNQASALAVHCRDRLACERQSCSKSSRCRRRHRQSCAQIWMRSPRRSDGGRDCHAFAQHILRRLPDSRGRQPCPNRGDAMTARAFTDDVLGHGPAWTEPRSGPVPATLGTEKKTFRGASLRF
jgi:hypothetical protein